MAEHLLHRAQVARGLQDVRCERVAQRVGMDVLPDARAQIDDLVLRLSALLGRCRKQSLSLLVPMGEEMSYRYQETLIRDLLHALRIFRDKMPR